MWHAQTARFRGLPLRTTLLSVWSLNPLTYVAMGFKDVIRAGGGKAILSHPALMAGGTEPLLLNNSYGQGRNRTPFSQAEAGRHLEAYGGDTDAIDWVMNAAGLMADLASNADYYFEKQGVKYLPEDQRGPRTPSSVKTVDPELAKLFDKPNPYMTYEEMMELIIIDYLLTGNAYWVKYRVNDSGKPLALYRLAPPFVKVVPGPFGIEGYTYEVPGMDPMVLDPSVVMHIRRSNPHSSYYGMGVIQGGARMLDLELALTDTQASYFEKRAQPSMVVQSDRRVPGEVLRRLQTQLRGMYSGPKNAGALMVLEAGLKYQSISPSAQEAMFEQLSKMSRDRILAMFKIPSSMLGIADDKSGGAEPADEQRIFTENTMKPLLKKISKAISRSITEPWEVNFKIDYEYMMPPEKRIALASAFAANPGVRLGEIREFLSLEPLGDERDDLVLNLPGGDDTAGGNTDDGNFPDQNLAGEAGRPPNPVNTRVFPSARASNTSATGSLAAARNVKSMDDIVAGFDKVIETKAADKIDFSDRLEAVPSDTLLKDRERAIDKITADLTKEIKNSLHTLERGLLDDLNNAAEGKAPGDRIRSKIRNSDAWKKFSTSFEKALERATKASISTSVVQQAALDNIPEGEVDYDQISREVINRPGGIRKIVQNFKNQMAKKIGVALDQGETKDDIAVAIRQSVDVWRDGHAESIALTEATHAYNEGMLTVAEDAGFKFVYVHDGDQHDEPCEIADGQVWELEYARANRLEHPRCRRAFTPVNILGEAV